MSRIPSLVKRCSCLLTGQAVSNNTVKKKSSRFNSCCWFYLNIIYLRWISCIVQRIVAAICMKLSDVTFKTRILSIPSKEKNVAVYVCM
jgi:hypothetical protein